MVRTSRSQRPHHLHCNQPRSRKLPVSCPRLLQIASSSVLIIFFGLKPSICQGERALVAQEDLDAVGCPGRNATTEEVGVFGQPGADARAEAPSSPPSRGRHRCQGFARSPPRLVTHVAKCSCASDSANSGTKNDTRSAKFSRIRRTRMPNTARIRMLASSTSALFGIPLLVAGGLSNLLIFAHEFVFGGAP